MGKGQSMKKKRTSNVLLFSALAVILCVTAKASEDTESSRAILGITINHLLGHRSVLVNNEATTEFQKRFEKICQQERDKKEKIGALFPWFRQYGEREKLQTPLLNQPPCRPELNNGFDEEDC